MSDDSSEWTDDFFLGYVAIHCETDRALFSFEHCVRLYRMAGHDVPDPTTPGFHAMHEDEAKPLIAKARERIVVQGAP
jgi:hypothetical protein